MDVHSTSIQVIELAAEITTRGSKAVEYDGLRILQHPDRLQQVLRGEDEDIVPVTIDLWPSLSCNARCPSCPYRLSGARDEVDRTSELSLIDVTLAEKVLIGAKKAGVHSVIFTGGGDPLLNPNIVEIAQIARSAGLLWALFTNGLLLSASMAAKLLEAQPSFLRVSLDAGTASEYAKIYNLPERAFGRVVDNIIQSARLARVRNTRAFGLSFTLAPTTSENELQSIRQLIERLRQEVGDGLGLVAFRPRIVHYRGGVPCVPQPHCSAFGQLADAIRINVIEPLKSDPLNRLRLDSKEGLFWQASRTFIRNGCRSISWHTTVDQEGVGYITAELAGVRTTGQHWGAISETCSFGSQWLGERRRVLYRDVVSGKISVPVVHRTTPLDTFLRKLREVAPEPLDQSEAHYIARKVERASWYRSPNPHFV